MKTEEQNQRMVELAQNPEFRWIMRQIIPAYSDEEYLALIKSARKEGYGKIIELIQEVRHNETIQ